MKTLRETKIGETVKVVKLHGEGAVKKRITDDVANEQSLTDDEGRKPQEGVAHRLVVCSQSFQNTNHLRALQNNDEQAANHGETSHANHQCQDNPNIDVEQREPREYLRVSLEDGL